MEIRAIRGPMPHNADMAERIGWTRDQQLIALRLYMRMSFGRLHGKNPEIIALARRIGRTPGLRFPQQRTTNNRQLTIQR